MGIVRRMRGVLFGGRGRMGRRVGCVLRVGETLMGK
jgi:hypothetical protein